MSSMTIKIRIEKQELFDEASSRIIRIPECEIELEHSLWSLSRFESKTHKRFIGNRELTDDDMLLYMKCMCTKEEYEDKIQFLTRTQIKQISDYIEDPMTATVFYKNGKSSREQITSEKLYCWMFNAQMPMELEHWHLNRLTTLLRLYANMNEPKKKMSKNEIMKQNASLNAARRAKMHSKG